MSEVRGQFRVLEERETPRGWSYRVVVGVTSENSTEHEVTLSWVDHNYWCGGTQAPSVTAEQVLGTLLSAMTSGPSGEPVQGVRCERLPNRFDLSLARRILPRFDSLLKRAV
ncbi:MAG: hypothetical protein KF805_05225 [Phycisphaeraceae bacterium]|nr:hypothetical protein [Phycisphaeraceae bacterium]